jgi:outer membrane protein assembly factor BamA
VRFRSKIVLFFLVFVNFLIPPFILKAQTEYVVINSITIEGNLRTKPKVIYNELEFGVGDTIKLSGLSMLLQENGKRLQSIGIFTIANINIKNWDTDNGKIDLLISVKESWFIFPSIILEFADRSFNVWWKEQNFALDRVNYGVRLDHLNTTGNKDKLKLKFQQGYTHKYELDYSFPYLSKGWGGGLLISYSENKEIGYKTVGNLLRFYKDPDERDMLRRFRVGVSISNRNNAFLRQKLRLEYHNNWVDTLVSKRLNPSYFLEGRNSISYPYLEYDLNYDRRVFPTYPEGGYLYNLIVKKSGINNRSDYNNLSLELKGEYYLPLVKDMYLALSARVKTNLIRNELAFANNTALGYGIRVRGYELYVIDGSDYFYLKSAVRYQLFSVTPFLGKFMPIKQFKILPISAHVRFAAETGFVNERTYTATNNLNNTMLFGFGPALDILILNNYLLSIEYNFNHIGDRGLFLQSSFNF